MMMAMASCNQTEYREITEDRVVSQPVDTMSGKPLLPGRLSLAHIRGHRRPTAPMP